MKGSIGLLLAVVFLPASSVDLTVSVRGVEPLYPNEKKESTPVTVRLYPLKDDARFTKASVDELWLKDKEMLGDDLLAGIKVFTVTPGAAEDKPRMIELREVSDQVRFIGVLALINKEDKIGPRKIVLSRSGLGTVLRLTGFHIELEK